jgi:hypothetical protein
MSTEAGTHVFHGLRSASTFGRLPKTRTFSLPFFSPKKGSRAQGEAPQTDHLEEKNIHSKDLKNYIYKMLRNLILHPLHLNLAFSCKSIEKE